MLTFKSLTLSTLMVFTGLSLVGCNLPKPQERAESANAQGAVATFKAQAMPDRSKAIETAVEGDFAIPTSKVFNLVACLKDVAYDKPIAGHEFLILEANEKSTTNKDGCVTWSERIKFNYLADSQYIRIDRTLQGTRLHKGQQRIAFAINPWSHGETLPAVLDPDSGNNIPRLVEDKKEVELALKGYSTSHEMINRRLMVDEGRFFITEQKLTAQGIVLSVEIHPKVNLQLHKMNGDLFLRPLMSGSFNANLKLIHIYQNQAKGEIRRLVSHTEGLKVHLQNGNLSIKSSMRLAALPTRGQFMLGLELEPISAPQGMKGFEGLYYLSEYDQIKTSGFLKLSPLASQDPDFKVSNYINASMEEILTPKVDTSKKGAVTTPAQKNEGALDDDNFDVDTYQRPKVEVAQLEFRFVRVGHETTSMREVVYNVKACLRHGLDQKIIRSHTFRITKFKQSSGEAAATLDVKTDNNACVNWDETVTFKYFDCQRYLKGFVQIENADLGMNEKLDIIVNPWETSGGSMARDLRYVDPTEKLVLNCKKEERPRSQIVLDNFNYNTLSYKYNIDSLLNLTMTKKIQVKMDPRLLVYSSLNNGRAEVQRLRDGVYLLKTAIVKNRDYDNNKNTYVASAEKLVNVMSGQVAAELSFSTQDLKALGNRNNLLVELFPVDESKVALSGNEVTLKNASLPLSSAIDMNSGLETPTFTGSITLNTDEASRSLRILDASAVSNYLLTGVGSNQGANTKIIDSIVDQGKKDLMAFNQRVQTRADKKVFVQENNLESLNLKTLDEKAPLVKALVGSSNLDQRLIVTKADLRDFVKTGKLSTAIAQKLCAFWSSDYFKKMYGSKGGVLSNELVNGFGLECYHTVAKDPSKYFQTEHQMFVTEVGGSQFVRGFNKGLTVGTNFSLATAHSTYTTRSHSLSVKAGLSKKFLDLFSLAADYGYTMSWATSDANSTSNTISVNASTSMTVQQNTFKIRINKYEQCAIVRLNPALFIKDTKSWFSAKDSLKYLNPQLSEQELLTATSRGLMICEGEVRQQAKDITENYYLIAQESGSTQMQDNGDERNRNFFIALRSDTDFQRFLLAMRGQLQMPASAESQETKVLETNEMIHQLFSLPGPTYPGVHRGL